MAYKLDDLREELEKHGNIVSKELFNDFRRNVSNNDVIFDIHKNGIYNEKQIKEYIVNLLTCCTENQLCNDSFETLFSYTYVRGMLDCIFILYKNGLLRNVST